MNFVPTKNLKITFKIGLDSTNMKNYNQKKQDSNLYSGNFGDGSVTTMAMSPIVITEKANNEKENKIWTNPKSDSPRLS